MQHGFQWALSSTTVSLPWGESVISAPIESYVPREFEGEYLATETPLLHQIARLAEEGRIRLFTSELVLFEAFGGPGTSLPWRPGHVFERAPPERLKSGFDYTIVFGRGEKLRDQLHDIFSVYPDEELAALRTRLGPKNLMDAVHLLTASRHRLNFFLCDRPFTKAYRSGKDTMLSWPVIPSELLRNLHENA